ncbi:hypothetical protein [Streptomyces sp. NPDC005283]|uniref:hypothetical protein n=1 Tax=Streptomyces sp. NPDC005283 TaxID=3156871 RepID=UPI0034538F78
MSSRWPVRRPTENAAIRAADRSERPLPPVQVLFADLITSYAIKDRRGLNLMCHRVARFGGEVGE